MKPIIFSTEMVRAILDGRKTQTRRVIKDGDILPSGKWLGEIRGGGSWCSNSRNDVLWTGFLWTGFRSESGADSYFMCRWKPGDTLWVRETWAPCAAIDSWIDNENKYIEATRLFLRAKNVWVERLQDITAHECVLEGVDTGDILENTPDSDFAEHAKQQFSRLWDRLNAKRGFSWKSNPFVWVVEFEKIKEGD